MNLLQELEKRVLILDGAMGTELMKKGVSIEPPELLNIEKPDVVLSIHSEYIKAGAEIVETNTFGANRIKLSEYGLENKVSLLNKRAVEIAKKSGKNVIVAGSIGPTGKLIEPLGKLTPEEVYSAAYEQAKSLYEAGADFILIETQIDSLEAKIMAIASKDAVKIPVALSFSYPMDGGLTVTGSSPKETSILLDSLPVDIVGINCGGHPEEFISFIKEYKKITTKPLIVYANAGIPKKTANRVIYPLSPKEYLKYALKYYELGANIIGGCCGTTPEHIKLIAKALKGKEKINIDNEDLIFTASSRSSSFVIKKDSRFLVVGENINPFGKKKFLSELKEKKLDTVRELSRKQEAKGADALDVNLGRTGDNDFKFYRKAISEVQKTSKLTLFLDNNSSRSIESALIVYGGKPIINSVNATKESYERMLPIAKKYGSGVVLLLMDERGIPEKSSDKLKIAEKLIKIAEDYGLRKRDIIIDPVVLTISTGGNSSVETLNTIKELSNLGFSTIIGLSNVSFGLPKRSLINRVFLSMAMGMGLKSAILNPFDRELMNVILAGDSILGKEKRLTLLIERMRDFEVEVKETDDSDLKDLTDKEKLYKYIVDGEKKKAKEITDKILSAGENPLKLLEDTLSPAMKKVGELYEKKVYFLPQLISSAEAMEEASKVLEKYIKKDKKKVEKKLKIVIATVKGDFHDIGKNIVSLVLRNYGYEVIDLGKNVSSEKIIETAISEKADVIGLSSLMTTTMDSMREVVELKDRMGLDVKIIIGGAAVSPSFAREIGADFYGKDPLDAVKKLEKLK